MLSAKQFIKKLIPPIVMEAYYKIRIGDQKYFSGVWEKFGDVKNEDPWSDASWASISRQKLDNIRIFSKKNELLPIDYSSSCLLIVNQLSEKEVCNVLDWGGGLDSSIIVLNGGLLRTKMLNGMLLTMNN